MGMKLLLIKNRAARFGSSAIVCGLLLYSLYVPRIWVQARQDLWLLNMQVFHSLHIQKAPTRCLLCTGHCASHWTYVWGTWIQTQPSKVYWSFTFIFFKYMLIIYQACTAFGVWLWSVRVSCVCSTHICNLCDSISWHMKKVSLSHCGNKRSSQNMFVCCDLLLT